MSTDSFPGNTSSQDMRVVSLDLSHPDTGNIAVSNLQDPIQYTTEITQNVTAKSTLTISPGPCKTEGFNITSDAVNGILFYDITVQKVSPGWKMLYYFTRDLSDADQHCNLSDANAMGWINLGDSRSRGSVVISDLASNKDGDTTVYMVYRLFVPGRFKKTKNKMNYFLMLNLIFCMFLCNICNFSDVTVNSTVEVQVQVWTASCTYFNEKSGVFQDDGCWVSLYLGILYTCGNRITGGI